MKLQRFNITVGFDYFTKCDLWICDLYISRLPILQQNHILGYTKGSIALDPPLQLRPFSSNTFRYL